MKSNAGMIVSVLLVAMLCGLGCASNYQNSATNAVRQKENRLQQELEETKEFLVRQDRQNQELIRQQAGLQKQWDEYRREQSRSGAELAAANERLRGQYAELKNRYDAASQKMQTQTVSFRRIPSVTIVPNNSLIDSELNFDDPDILPVRREESDLVVELQDRLLFARTPEDQYSVKLTKEGEERLQKVAVEVRRCYPDSVYCIVGHHDGPVAGTEGVDMSLQYTLQKAAAVSNWLIGNTAIEGNRIQVAAKGYTRPITANISEENRERNRRIEWVIRAGDASVPR